MIGVDTDRAIEAAARAYSGWAATPWRERVATMRRAADLIEGRVYEIGAVLALEVGKNLVMKRFAARGRGRSSRIEKPFAQITVIVREAKPADEAATES